MRQLHLAGHLRLMDEPLDAQFSSWVVPKYPKIRLEQVAALSRRFVKLRPRGEVPYGFDQPFLAVKRSGELEEDLVGLTCASLVVGIFDTAGTPIVDPKDWYNNKEDRAWQTKIASLLEQRYPNQAKELLKQNGATRYRPIHVFGGACCEKPPATKSTCVRQLQILMYLRSQEELQQQLVHTSVYYPTLAGLPRL